MNEKERHKKHMEAQAALRQLQHAQEVALAAAASGDETRFHEAVKEACWKGLAAVEKASAFRLASAELLPPKERKDRTSCECADSGCPAHETVPACGAFAETTLFRVDMEDRTGTRMCTSCAEDAMQSGLFREEER